MHQQRRKTCSPVSAQALQSFFPSGNRQAGSCSNGAPEDDQQSSYWLSLRPVMYYVIIDACKNFVHYGTSYSSVGTTGNRYLVFMGTGFHLKWRIFGLRGQKPPYGPWLLAAPTPLTSSPCTYTGQ